MPPPGGAKAARTASLPLDPSENASSRPRLRSPALQSTLLPEIALLMPLHRSLSPRRTLCHRLSLQA
jgi:hypothetical protein